MKKNVLVTGGAGFIGSHLTETLYKNGFHVTVLDDFNDFYSPARKQENTQSFHPSISVIKGDIRDTHVIESVFSNQHFDAIFHLAARAGVRPSIQDPRLYLSTNIDGTLNLLEACRHHGVKKFIFASSSSVYGVNPKIPFSEQDLIDSTISPYAATKLAGEQLCSNYARLYDIHSICLRFFTVYGPRQRPDLAIAKFTTAILEGHPIDRYGDGETYRDYTYIEDIISGIIASYHYSETNPFDIINLSCGDTTSLNQLIHHIEQAAGRKALIRQLPEQPGDVPRTFGDITKARKKLGYNPTTTITRGIERYFHSLNK
jgi:UDP-glucuronate 4-epimerase